MEQEQFKKEVVPLRGQLLFYAYRLLEDKADAEDIVQEVMLKLWYMRDELEQYNSIPALTVTMTKHLCINKLKANQRVQENLSEVVLVTNDLSPYRQLEQKNEVEQVMRIIDCLPGLQQTTLRMKHIDGFEVEEIAELTGCTVDAVRMNLSRGRRRVKELFFQIQK